MLWTDVRCGYENMLLDWWKQACFIREQGERSVYVRKDVWRRGIGERRFECGDSKLLHDHHGGHVSVCR